MTIDVQDLKAPEALEHYCEQNLDKMGRNYICPWCKSGTGPKRTPAFHIYGDHFKCFKCGESGDLMDLIGHVEGIEGFKAQETRAAEFCNVMIEDGTTVKAERKNMKPQLEAVTDYAEGRANEAAKLRVWKAAYPGSEGEAYAKARGIDGYPLEYGWDASTKRLVISWPNNDFYHIDRDTTGQSDRFKYIKPHSKPYLKNGVTTEMCVGPQPLFETGVWDSESFVVVEGPLDAGALMSLGVENVVALCGTGYYDLVNVVTERKYRGGVVVMLDHDIAGMNTTTKLVAALETAGVAAVGYQWDEGDEKDADEMVRASKGDQVAKKVREALDAAAGVARDAGYTTLRLMDPARIAEQIYFQEDADTPIPTGFAELDRMIGGGLMRGLYVIGATSSFGKTTLAVMLADHIAASGHPVLFVTIEQSAQEIVGKSLSRLTHDRHNSTYGGLTAQEITTNGRRWGEYKYDLLKGATTEYTAEVAPCLRILEGVTRPTVDEVRQAAMDMAAEFGTTPVIVLDYLQLLRSPNERDTDKQSVDYNVTALRILARDLKTPIWCVATLNRESYSGPVDLDSFKESGAIEYGADYLFGLQPRGIADEVKSVKSAVEKRLKGNAFVTKAKRQNPRQVELTVLKNRQGEVTGTDTGIPLTYFPRTNLFVECR